VVLRLNGFPNFPLRGSYERRRPPVGSAQTKDNQYQTNPSAGKAQWLVTADTIPREPAVDFAVNRSLE